uniref:Uncharacterized protein n=1 Tax=Lotharella globosa TaxID=91324 RepID=A0A7S3YUE8_9EUKA
MGSGPLAVTCSLITVVFILLPIAWYRRGCLKALMEVPASSTWWLTGASRRRMWGILVFRGATFIMMLVIQIVQFAYRGVGVLRFLTVWTYILMTVTFALGFGLSLEGWFLHSSSEQLPPMNPKESETLANSSRMDFKLGTFNRKTPNVSPKQRVVQPLDDAAEPTPVHARHLVYIVMSQMGLSMALFIDVVYWGLLRPHPQGHSTWFQHAINGLRWGWFPFRPPPLIPPRARE